MDLTSFGSLGALFTGLQNQIIAELGSRIITVGIDKAKAANIDKKLEASFCECGGFLSHFENDGDSFGQAVLLVFSQENLLDLYHQLKNETGYNYRQFIESKLEVICDQYNIDAGHFITFFADLFFDSVYKTDKALAQEMFLGEQREEINRNFKQSHENEEAIMSMMRETLAAIKSQKQEKDEKAELIENSAANTQVQSETILATLKQQAEQALSWELKYPKLDIYWSNEEKRLSALKELTEQWKRERESAPAWFVLPYSKRSTLRSYTRHEDLLYTCKSASSKERFDFAYELIWRYEHAFLSYDIQFVKSVRDIFDSYDFEDGMDYKSHWFELGLFLLREYREELDVNNWNAVYGQLKKESEAYYDGDARLKFEHIKFLFAQMRISDTCRFLAGFTCKNDSFEMRLQIVGIKAECGYLDKAYEELLQLENDLRKYEEDAVRAGSLLGLLYCMKSFLFQAINPFGNDDTLQTIWKQESLYNPFFDFSKEQLYFSRDLNQSRKKDFKTEPFDITCTNRTIIYGSNVHHENYDFYRLLDISCLPLHINFIRLLEEDISDFVSVLIRQFHYIGWQILMRLGSNKTAENLLTRKELSKLLTAGTSTLYDAFDFVYKAVDDDVDIVMSLPESQHGNAYSHILDNGIFLLQYLSCVVDRSRQKRLLDLMCKVIDADVVKGPRVLNRWISDIMKVTDEHAKAECLNELLNCSSKERQDYGNENSLDPFDVFASFERVQHLYEKTYVKPDMIDSLLEKAEKDEHEKKHIIPRLEQLYRINRLDDVQKKRFAEVLWKDVPEGALPLEGSYYPSFFLQCPAPDGVDVIRNIKSNLLDISQFKAVCEKELSAFSFGSYPLWDKIKGVNYKGADFWTVDEVEALIKEFINYWEALKKNYEKVSRKEFYEDEFASRVRAFISVVASFNRSQMLKTSKAVRERLLEVAEEIQGYGICSIQLSVLATDDGNLAMFESSLIHGLRSSNKNEADAAVGASEILIMNSYGTAATDTVLREIMLLCLYRKEPGLHHALNVLHNFLYRNSDIVLHDADIKLLQESLGAIASQTKYDRFYQCSEEDFRNNILTRISCAGLAYQFYLYEERCGIGHSETVLEWRDICIGDKSASEFAEVRRRWLE